MTLVGFRLLQELMEDLVDLLERENALLERPRSRELGPVIEEKQALFKLYEEQVHALANDNDFAAALEPELKERLKDIRKKAREQADSEFGVEASEDNGGQDS